METKRIKLTVARATDQEISELQDFIEKLKFVIEDNQKHIDDEMDNKSVNKEIALAALKLPSNAFLVPLNTAILMTNYQDKESTILEHPKWIMEMVELFSEMDSFLSDDSYDDCIKKNQHFYNKIKEILKNSPCTEK